jgi:hypothetical protein
MLAMMEDFRLFGNGQELKILQRGKGGLYSMDAKGNKALPIAGGGTFSRIL